MIDFARRIRSARNFLQCRLLRRLPGRVARHGDAVLRAWTLRKIRRSGVAPTLIVTHDLSRSGAPLLVVEMARTLRGRGHTPVILSPVPGPFLDDLLDDGFDVLIDDRLPAATYLNDLAAMARLAICNTAATAEVVRRLARRVPVLWYLHEVSLLDQLLAQSSMREAVAAADVIWAGSALCAERLASLRSDVTVVPYGVAPLAAAAPRLGGDMLKIGIFGSIELRKGQDLAVAAMAMLSDEERSRVRLLLYGRILDPAFARSVLEYVDGAHLRYLGELDRAAYVAAMQDVDAVLICSRDDTLPLVSIDALGLGKLLLLTPSVGTSLWLQDGSDALIARETSAEGIRDLIVRAIGPMDRPAFSRAAKLAFTKNFSAEAFRDRLFAAVDQLERAA